MSVTIPPEEWERHNRGALDMIAHKVSKIDVLVESHRRLEDNQTKMEASIARLAEAVSKLAVIEERQAQALGCDDIKSAVTYADESAVPKFQQEGQAMRRLRSLAWARCYEILNAVQTGQRPIPTEDELIAEMEALK